MIASQDELFQEPNRARYGANPDHRNLFLPKYLKEDSRDYRLEGEKQQQAHAILLKWADLESSGKLERKTETALQGEFLAEVFGKALGYVLFTENQKQWNIEANYAVNGGTADAALGLFEDAQKQPPIAIVELKGSTAVVDRDRSGGRTGVQQCWDYLIALPECPWGIVCNYVSFRLYHRNYTTRAYQLFVLQDLRRWETFQQFYYLFERGGLIPVAAGQRSRAVVLLEKTAERQQQVGDELYGAYNHTRTRLIEHLRSKPHRKSLDSAIRIAQKLIDRIVFIAFCEDRGLLPERSLDKAHNRIAPFARVTNPRWRNFLDLFRSVDKGNEKSGISPYNGGLFREDDEVDNLQLEDDWTNFFATVGHYDFREEVNVDVLGHLFERSVNDIGRIRLGGLFEGEVDENHRPKMAKSAQRKRFGIYYTPPEFTSFIVHNTVARLVNARFETIGKQRGIAADAIGAVAPDPKIARYWRECLEALRGVKIVDPACGSGAFLIRAYDLLEEHYQDVLDHLVFHDGPEAEALRDEIPDLILRENLFGVDVSPEAVEITQLALWIRTARMGKTLADLSKNIIWGNSLVGDPAVHPHAMRWEEAFRDVFSRENGGFDCVIGNPPWERMKLQEREFFDAAAPDIATAVNAATRRNLIAKLAKTHPDIHERYLNAKAEAERTLGYVRASGRFPLTGKGDINTYASFAELARCIVAKNGRVGLLVPSGIATDHTTQEFFGELADSKVLSGLYDFENRHGIFPDIDRRFKFSVLLFGGAESKSESADFVFFAHRMEDLEDKQRHIALSARDLKLLNPNTRTCPIFRSRRDAELTKAIYRRIPVLVDRNRKKGGNPWGVKFLRMFDQTNDAELFQSAEQLKADRFKRDGARWKKGKKLFLPLYEAKMIQAYDHRAASVVVKDSNWMRQGQTEATILVQHQNPEFAPEPRWWVNEAEVLRTAGGVRQRCFLGFKDITSPTNERTMIAAAIPWSAVTNHFPLILTEQDARLNMCLLANLNAFVLDYAARQKIGGVTLNFFIVEQLPILPPDAYADRCPWDRRLTLEKWISDRVLKLTCTSNDMRPLAEAAGFDPLVYRWKPEERLDLQAQLAAAYFLLYEIERDDVEYMLSTFSGTGEEGEFLLKASSTLELILQHYDHLRERTASSS